MTIPSYRDVDLALLLELVRENGPLRPAEGKRRVERHFPELSEEDLAQTRPDGRTKAFFNMVNWSRDHLRVRSLLVLGGPQGVWRVNEAASGALVEDLRQKGVAPERAQRFIQSEEGLGDLLGVSWARPVGRRTSGERGRGRMERGSTETRTTRGRGISELTEEEGPRSRDVGGERGREWAQRQLLDRLNNLAGYEFEQLIARVLDALGFRDTQVTGRSGDEGVDLITWLWSPLVSAKVAVQVKRHSGNVGPRDISYLRDRWAHRADRLMFITTSDFTVGAREVAAEDRDKEVQLVKGEELVQVMLEHGLGVRAEPQVTYGVDEDFFTG